MLSAGGSVCKCGLWSSEGAGCRVLAIGSQGGVSWDRVLGHGSGLQSEAMEPVLDLRMYKHVLLG